jgi:hypothetical protein
MLKQICFIIILLSLFLGTASASETIIPVQGKCIDYSWANNSNHFAVLLERDNNRKLIYILDADKGKIIRTLYPGSEYDIKAFDWEVDDSGFVLKVFDKGYTLLLHIDLHGDPGLTAGEDGFSEVYPSSGLFLGPRSLVALTIWGEGHPDVILYEKGIQIFSTDVYPGTISCIGWKNGFLFCISDMDLTAGIKRDDRKKNGYNQPGPDKLYKIDIVTGKAFIPSLSIMDIRNTSYDKRYVFEVENINNKTKLILSDYKKIF